MTEKKLIGLLAVIAGAVVALILTKLLFNRVVKKNNNLHTRFLIQMIRLVIIVGAIINGVGVVSDSISLGTLFFRSSALAVAIIGFAAQPVIADLISGYLISINKPFEIGDRIEVEGASNLVASGEELVVGFERSEIRSGNAAITAARFAGSNARPTDELGGGAGRSVGGFYARNSVGIVVPVIVGSSNFGIASAGINDAAVDIVVQYTGLITGDKEVVIVGGGIGIVSASASDRLVIIEDIIEVGMVGLGLPGGDFGDFVPVDEAVAAVSGGGKVNAMLCRLKALDRKGVWSIGAGGAAHECRWGDRDAAGIWEIKGSGSGMAVDGNTLSIVHNPFVLVIATVGGIAASGAGKVVIDGFPVLFVGILSISEGAVSGS